MVWLPAVELQVDTEDSIAYFYILIYYRQTNHLFPVASKLSFLFYHFLQLHIWKLMKSLAFPEVLEKPGYSPETANLAYTYKK